MSAMWSDPARNAAINMWLQFKGTAQTSVCPCRAHRRIQDLERENKAMNLIVDNGLVHQDHDPEQYIPMLLDRDTVNEFINNRSDLPRDDNVVPGDGLIALSDDSWHNLRQAYLPKWDKHRKLDSVEELVVEWFIKAHLEEHFKLHVLAEAFPVYLMEHNLGDLGAQVVSDTMDYVEEKVKPLLPIQRDGYNTVKRFADQYLRENTKISIKYEGKEVFCINCRDHVQWAFREVVVHACDLLHTGVDPDLV